MNIPSGSYLLGLDPPLESDVPPWALWGIYDIRIPNWTGNFFVDKQSAMEFWIALGRPRWLSIDEVDHEDD